VIRQARIGGMIGTAILVVLLGGCTQTYAERELSQSDIALARPVSPIDDNALLAVRIRTFDPGKLPEDPDLAKGLSKEIRNAEAYYIPVQLKNTMQRSDHWGPVRVVPKGTRDGEVVVDGHILESDGEILRLAINVADGTGNEWFAKEYTGVVNDEMYRRAEQQGVDAFQPLYNEIANDIAAYQQKLVTKDALMIRTVTELRFGAEFAPDVFNGYVQNTTAAETPAGPMQKFVSFFTSPSEDENSSPPYRAVRLPSNDDPMVQRVNRIRAREEFLIEFVLEDVVQIRHLRVDVLRYLQAYRRVHRAEGQHDLEGMQFQIGRLETIAEAANVDDAIAHALENFVDLDD